MSQRTVMQMRIRNEYDRKWHAFNISVFFLDLKAVCSDEFPPNILFLMENSLRKLREFSMKLSQLKDIVLEKFLFYQ